MSSHHFMFFADAKTICEPLLFYQVFRSLDSRIRTKTQRNQSTLTKQIGAQGFEPLRSLVLHRQIGTVTKPQSRQVQQHNSRHIQKPQPRPSFLDGHYGDFTGSKRHRIQHPKFDGILLKVIIYEFQLETEQKIQHNIGPDSWPKTPINWQDLEPE